MSYELILMAALGCGGAVWLWMRSRVGRLVSEKEQLTGENNRLKSASVAWQEEKLAMTRLNGEMEATIRHLTQQIEQQSRETEAMKQQVEKEFRLIASEIIEEKSRQLTETGEKGIASLLNPLKEKLTDFKNEVEKSHSETRLNINTLREKIKELVTLNQRVSEEANNLAKALKGESKTQGDWGEMILETILEKSGLKRDEEYFVQETIKDDQGRAVQSHEGRIMRPDVRVKYPDNREIVIDSKVSLTHYVEYINAPSEGEANTHLSLHLQSMRRHIDELASRSYQDFVESLDFVMMFVPNEAAYVVAMQADNTLWQYAYTRKVILISPTNLITALRLVYDLWKREYQNRNAIEIAQRGALLYDKLVGLVESVTEIGTGLDRTRKSYDKALNQLTTGNGNLISQAQKLSELGVKAKKALPQSLLRPDDNE